MFLNPFLYKDPNFYSDYDGMIKYIETHYPNIRKLYSFKCSCKALPDRNNTVYHTFECVQLHQKTNEIYYKYQREIIKHERNKMINDITEQVLKCITN